MRLLAMITLLWAMPVYALAAPAETPLQAPGPHGALRGTVLTPENAKGPVILIIPGSGPTNRDGNNPLGIRASSYKLLAEGLAKEGITTVRIDKRGMFGSSRAGDPNAVTIEAYTHDIRAWVDVIRMKKGVSCVWVMGHSEGGLVALASGRSVGGICGLILLAAPGRPAGHVLAEQLRSNPEGGPEIEQALAVVAALEMGRHVNPYALNPTVAQMFNPRVQDFLISMFAIDPARLIAEYHGPVLIIQGKRDIQVSVKDAERLKDADPAAKLLLLPDTNHVLKKVSLPGRAANQATYANPHLPLAEGITEGIAAFVTPPAAMN